MLDGRYPSSEFAELRPRIVWDRIAGTIRARQGARQLAVTNAGTIPDRGLYAVTLPDGRRVGELDEEMVYEARAGPDVPARRVDLADRGDRPRPGDRHAGARACRARCRSGRATASGARASSARRSAPSRAGRSTSDPRRALAAEYDLDERAAPQPGRVPARAARRDAGGPVRPGDRGRALPRRDRRLAAVRAVALRRPRARRLGARARAPGSATSSGSSPTRSGPTTGSSSTSPTPSEPTARAELVLIEPDEVEDLVVAELGALGPVRRPLPRERRPRAADPARPPRQAHAALAAAAEGAVAARGRAQVRRVPDHPRDLPRVPARRARPARRWSQLLDQLHARARSRWSRSRRRPPRRSPPRCCSTTSRPTCTRATRPNAERRAAALSLDRDLLRELLGQEELRDLIDPGALAAVEADLQWLSDDRRVADPRRRCTTCCARSAT